MYIALTIILSILAYVFGGAFTLRFMISDEELKKPDAGTLIVFGMLTWPLMLVGLAGWCIACCIKWLATATSTVEFPPPGCNPNKGDYNQGS